MPAKLEWRGPQISRKVRSVARWAIGDTIGAASDQAASATRVRTGEAAASIAEHPKPVRDEGPRVVGRWGADPNHPAAWRVLFLEKGVYGRPGDHMLQQAADANYRPGLLRRLQGRFRS